MSTTTNVYPKCHKCGLDVIGLGKIVYGSNFIWHPECLDGSVAATPSPSPYLSPQDPAVILAGIKQFGLAPDGADLRDLEAALSRLRAELEAVQWREKDREKAMSIIERAAKILGPKVDAAEAALACMREALTEAQGVIQQIINPSRFSSSPQHVFAQATEADVKIRAALKEGTP